MPDRLGENSLTLSDGQRSAVEKVLGRIYRIAQNSHGSQKAREDQTLNADADRVTDSYNLHDSYNFFVLDGARGTGKSTTLDWVRTGAKALGRQVDRNRLFQNKPQLTQMFAANDFSVRHGDNHTIHQLEKIFPEMFDPKDIEFPDILLDQIRRDLRNDLTGFERPVDFPHYLAPTSDYRPATRQRNEPEQSDSSRQRHATKLMDDLRHHIDPGWTYARDIGREVLARDSINYREFVERKGEYSSLAAQRHVTWYKFLSEYLDYKQAQLLMVTIDDSDLQPVVAQRMLNDLRLYLSHPRVVVVMALNMDALKRVLRVARFKDRNSLFELAKFGRRSEGDWDPDELRQLYKTALRDLKREEEEMFEQLGKVLPHRFRFAIGKPSFDEAQRMIFRGALTELRAFLPDNADHWAQLSFYLLRTRYRGALADLSFRDLGGLAHDIHDAQTPPDWDIARLLFRTTFFEKNRSLGKALQPDQGRPESTVSLHASELASMGEELLFKVGGNDFGTASGLPCFAADVFRTMKRLSLSDASTLPTDMMNPGALDLVVSHLTFREDATLVNLQDGLAFWTKETEGRSAVLPLNMVAIADANSIFPFVEIGSVLVRTFAEPVETDQGSNPNLHSLRQYFRDVAARSSAASQDAVIRLCERTVIETIETMKKGEVEKLTDVFADYMDGQTDGRSSVQLERFIKLACYGAVLKLSKEGVITRSQMPDVQQKRLVDLVTSGLIFREPATPSRRTPYVEAVIGDNLVGLAFDAARMLVPLARRTAMIRAILAIRIAGSVQFPGSASLGEPDPTKQRAADDALVAAMKESAQWSDDDLEAHVQGYLATKPDLDPRDALFLTAALWDSLGYLDPSAAVARLAGVILRDLLPPDAAPELKFSPVYDAVTDTRLDLPNLCRELATALAQMSAAIAPTAPPKALAGIIAALTQFAGLTPREAGIYARAPRDAA